MAGPIAIGLVFGWLAAMGLATVPAARPGAALARVAAMNLLRIAAAVTLCTWYRGWAGGVTAVTGALFGALLAGICCAVWIQRRRAEPDRGWPGPMGRTI